MNVVRRRLLIGAALFFTVGASAYLHFSEKHDQPTAVSISSHNLSPHVLKPSKNNTLATQNFLQSRFLQGSAHDIFLPKKVVVEEPKPEAVVVAPLPPPTILPPQLPPPVPTAPPIPFVYIGKYKEDDELVVYLNYRGRNLIVKAGDILLQAYKIEDISPPLLTMTYLPMGIKQTIQIGESQ